MKVNRLLEAFDSEIMKPIKKDVMVGGPSEFISLLFKAKEDAHITHIEQRSRGAAVHNALGIFYEGLEDVIDTFAETVMGKYGQLTLSFNASNISNPLMYMEELYSKVEKGRMMFTEGYILNQIDSIHELIAHTIYRLKYVTSQPSEKASPI